MPIHLAPPDAECRVLTYREGLLSGLGHDLELAVTRFTIEVDDAARTADASFDAGSLRVVRALRDGAELPGALGDGDRQSIEASIRGDVLHADRHPAVRFRSTAVTEAAGGYDVAGTLALHGVERPVTLALRPEGDRLVAAVTLHQPDFGIRPYRALLGTLKVKPDVTVRLSLPAAPPR